MTAERTAEPVVYGDFADILKPGSKWRLGGFALPDGSYWQYREPDAVVLVQNGRLRVTAVPLTRSHDRVQFLDNAKHMYFSRDPVQIPVEGEITFDITIRARGFGTAPGDLYDGFVSFNLLDFNTGLALDFFVSNDRIATVYARLPFPGVTVADTGEVKYFAVFKELDVPTEPWQPHDYRIAYSRAADEVRWYVDGVEVNREAAVPDKMDSVTLAMGLMTEKDIRNGRSVSLHGQGLQGEWSPTTITRLRG